MWSSMLEELFNALCELSLMEADFFHRLITEVTRLPGND